MMSGPHFEQLRTRLKGLGLGEGRDEEAQKFAQGKSGAKISHKGGGVCETRTHQGGVRNFRTGENGVRNFRIPVILQDREHAIFEKWCKSKFAQGKWCAKFSHTTRGCANFAESCLFSPVVPCFHQDFILQAFLPTC